MYKFLLTTIKYTIAICVIFLGGAHLVGAYEITDRDVEVRGDYILEPAKLEVSIDPGETKTEILYVINRTDSDMTYKIEIEDTKGSERGDQAIILLGDEKGPYSLKDYLHPEVMEFTLGSKQQIELPVSISVPIDAEPGGLYGTVLITSTSNPNIEAGEGARGGSVIISRVGALFFVRVNGEVEETGYLEDFSLKGGSGPVFSKSPTGFNLLFNNDGNIHLNPYGFITITNFSNSVIGEIEVLPYFAMPQSLRTRDIDWKSGTMLGRYKATAKINRGYGNIIDEKTIVFWVIPAKLIVIVFTSIFIIIFAIRWFLSQFEFKRKTKE